MGEDTVVERNNGVLVVRATSVGAYGVLLINATEYSPQEILNGAHDAEVQRARQLVEKLRVVSRAEFEETLNVSVS